MKLNSKDRKNKINIAYDKIIAYINIIAVVATENNQAFKSLIQSRIKEINNEIDYIFYNNPNTKEKIQKILKGGANDIEQKLKIKEDIKIIIELIEAFLINNDDINIKTDLKKFKKYIDFLKILEASMQYEEASQKKGDAEIKLVSIVQKDKEKLYTEKKEENENIIKKIDELNIQLFNKDLDLAELKNKETPTDTDKSEINRIESEINRIQQEIKDNKKTLETNIIALKNIKDDLV